ncbi:hypothetical protein J6590_058475 [Homalodisca vitripennis]|nr:hypothetical protein J6590_058475 [Homalodisca vitripennis]
MPPVPAHTVTAAPIETITDPARVDSSEPHGPLENNIKNNDGSQSSTTPLPEFARPFADRMFQPSTSAGYPSPEDVRPLQKAAPRKETNQGRKKRKFFRLY